MTETASTTIHADGSLWVAVYEVRHADGTMQVARHVFGAEPSDAELWQWVRESGLDLIDRACSAPRVPVGRTRIGRPIRNPKRLARQAAKEQACPSTSTASQEALKATLTQQRQQARTVRRQDAERSKQEKRRKRVAKRKAQRRGH